MRDARYRYAGRLLDLVMALLGIDGICLPPVGIILRKRVGSYDDRHHAYLKFHEAIHWSQAERYGVPWFYLRYILLWLRHGYRRHPMEIEAVQKGLQLADKHLGIRRRGQS